MSLSTVITALTSPYDDTGLQAAVTALQAAVSAIPGGVAVTDAVGNQRGTLKFVEATGDLELTLTDAQRNKAGRYQDAL